MYTTHETILKVSNVNQNFDGKEILQNINLDIKDIRREGLNQGQIVSLIGRSGIGKSTLFRILTGLDHPTSGTIDLFGNPIKTGDIGMVPQNYLLFKWRTIRKNLEISIKKNTKLDQKQKVEYLNYMIENFEITDHLDKYPFQLSGGQRQRVSIIQQIINGSDVILLDEPFSGLDSIMIDKVSQMLIQVSLTDELKTLIIVSHDITNSVAISDTVFLMNKPDPNRGATIVKKIDLAEMGLAWRQNIKEESRFHEVLKDIKSLL